MRILAGLITVGALLLVWLVDSGYQHISFVRDLGMEAYVKQGTASSTPSAHGATNTSPIVEEAHALEVTHVQTPEHVKAIYMSSWVAGTPSFRDKLVKLIDDTELNAVVIDVKDNTGVITWDERMRDLPEFLDELHKKNIYVIARISAFQDPAYVKAYPELAVTNVNTGGIWKDRKDMPWIDTGSRQMWEYLASIGKDAYARGFDELNYDYIRFPTDGDLQAMRFPISGEKGLTSKPEIVGNFYKFLHETFSPLDIPISGDLFGIINVNQVETKTLGQDLHVALQYFDYVAPMVYPSHFYAGTAGYQNPAAHPGEIITYSMKGAIKIAEETASSTGVAPSTLIKKLRPWYQDFDMGAVYTKEMVRAQIEAGYALDIDSWMLWDPANKYTPSALTSE